MAEKAAELSGRVSPALGFLGRFYATAGRTTEARQLLEELEERRRVSYALRSSIGAIHRGLGDMEKGPEWLVRGIEERDPINVLVLKCEPAYDEMRHHPVCQDLLRKMNLEP